MGRPALSLGNMINCGLTSNEKQSSSQQTHQFCRTDRTLPQNRHSSGRHSTESSVPHWEQGIPQPQDVLDDALVRFIEQERLAALGIDMGMGAEERCKRADLVPSNEHLGFWVTEETSNIG
jgi:hypothetical protein